MTAKLIQDNEIWDKFVDDSPYGLLYHKWNFLKIVEKATGYNFIPYGVYDGTLLIGLFPLFYKKYNGMKMVFSPPPKTGIPYLGFVLNSDYSMLKQDKKEKQLSILVNDINDELKKLSLNYISIAVVPYFTDIRQFKWNGYTVNTSFTYIIDLSPTYEEIWNNFKKNTRKQISKAESANLKLIKSEDVSTFYNLESSRYKEQGLNIPLVDKKYIEDLYQKFSENLGLYYLFDSNEKIIGSISTQEYKRFILWMGNTKMDDNIYGNEYIVWELIKKAKEEGYNTLEIVGANKPNLCQFKSKFNPSLESCFIINKSDLFGKIAELAYRNVVKKRIV